MVAIYYVSEILYSHYICSGWDHFLSGYDHLKTGQDHLCIGLDNF